MLSGLPTAGRWSLAHWGRPSGNSSCECVINRPRTERCKLKKKEMHGMDPMSKNWQKKKKKTPSRSFSTSLSRSWEPPARLRLFPSLPPLGPLIFTSTLNFHFIHYIIYIIIFFFPFSVFPFFPSQLPRVLTPPFPRIVIPIFGNAKAQSILFASTDTLHFWIMSLEEPMLILWSIFSFQFASGPSETTSEN